MELEYQRKMVVADEFETEHIAVEISRFIPVARTEKGRKFARCERRHGGTFRQADS
jgi:hypothetical protein